MIKAGKVLSVEINPSDCIPHLIDESSFENIKRVEPKLKEEEKVIQINKRKKHESNQNKAALVMEQTKTEQTSEIKPEVKVKSKNLKIEDIVEIGPKGVTNKQMIPAIERAINEGSGEKINMLKQSFPAVFEGSCKYIKKNMMDKLNKLV